MDPAEDCSSVDDVALLGGAAADSTGATGGALIADPTGGCSCVDNAAIGGSARAAGGGAVEG